MIASEPIQCLCSKGLMTATVEWPGSRHWNPQINGKREYEIWPLSFIVETTVFAFWTHHSLFAFPDHYRSSLISPSVESRKVALWLVCSVEPFRRLPRTSKLSPRMRRAKGKCLQRYRFRDFVYRRVAISRNLIDGLIPMMMMSNNWSLHRSYASGRPFQVRGIVIRAASVSMTVMNLISTETTKGDRYFRVQSGEAIILIAD